RRHRSTGVRVAARRLPPIGRSPPVAERQPRRRPGTAARGTGELMRTRYPKDPALSPRLGGTIYLLGLVSGVFIGALPAVGGPDELEAGLAHEPSHVARRDVPVMTVASFLGARAGMVTLLTLCARMFGGGFGGGRGGRDRDNGAVAVLGIMLISIVVYAISFL